MFPNYEPWKVVKKIGAGSFGTVYEIQRQDFGYTYKAALKVISIPQSEEEIAIARLDNTDDNGVTAYFQSVTEEIVKEIQMMSQLKGNTNIVSYENHIVKKQENNIGWDIMIQMELLTSLSDYMTSHTFTKRDVIKLGIDICSALERCQEYGIQQC